MAPSPAIMTASSSLLHMANPPTERATTRSATVSIGMLVFNGELCRPRVSQVRVRYPLR